MTTPGFMSCFIHRAADFKAILLCTGLFIFAGAALMPAEADGEAPVFKTDARVEQTAPYLTLEWDQPDADSGASLLFELEIATAKDFTDARLHYRGPDRASFVSGLAEGDYYVRVRSFGEGETASDWSAPVYLTIEYESLATALVLFGLGAVVAIATVALVVAGDRRTRREEANS